MKRGIWAYISGSQCVDAVADFDVPYPGGIQGHSMVIDNKGRYFYVFGGKGYLERPFINCIF